MGPLPKDFKHITARHYAERKRKERRRMRIVGVLIVACVAAGLAVISWS